MHYLLRLLAWTSQKQESHGLPVFAPSVPNDGRQLIRARLDEALNLLQASAPARYRRFRNSIEGFLILGSDSVNASYQPNTRICQLRQRFMLSHDTTAAEVACTVVHEATHGWLFKLGIPYDEPRRYRIELVCIRAALLTAQRLPGAEAEVERCRRQLSFDPGFLSNESRNQRLADNLRALGYPGWLIRVRIWLRRRA